MLQCLLDPWADRLRGCLLMEDSDARHLERALDLAQNAGGRTSPNPLVGAVVVKHGRVRGRRMACGPGM